MRGRRPQPSLLPISTRPGKPLRSSSGTTIRIVLLVIGLLVSGYSIATVVTYSRPKAPKPVKELREEYEAETGLPVDTSFLTALKTRATASATDIDGKEVHLSKYDGNVTLVVNVASACGYTDANYKGLQQLHEDYQGKGLVILGFPCNQFGSQESGSEAEIREFCTSKYHVTFDMFSKVEVNGPNAHPVYKFLKRELPESEHGGGGHGPGQELHWNFNKILVDRDGRPQKFFYQDFDREALEAAIKQLLAQTSQSSQS